MKNIIDSDGKVKCNTWSDHIITQTSRILQGSLFLTLSLSLPLSFSLSLCLSMFLSLSLSLSLIKNANVDKLFHCVGTDFSKSVQAI